MSESFSVGEIAIIHYADGPDPRNGDEVAIIALAQAEDYVSPITGKWIKAGKLVVEYRGTCFQAYPKHFRKRRPPREPVSTWDDVIVWRPKEMAHG